MSPEELPPRRLLDSDGPAGDCLRQALVEQELSVPRFVRLREKRLLRLRLQRTAWAVALAAAALVLLPKLRHEAPRPSISAEHTPASAGEPLTSESSPRVTLAASHAPAVTAPAPVAAPPLVTPRARKAPASSGRDELDREATPAPQPAPPVAPEIPAATPSANGSAKACAELARSGAASEGLRCYEALASGGGMSAELALFEQARLEGKVLRQPGRALATLEAYRRRFPQGSLRAEVMLAQIEWLVAAGDSARARSVVDEALASGLLRERAPELERLRDSLERSRGAN